VLLTIDIPAPLLDEAERMATARSTTIEALIQTCLRREVTEQPQPNRFRLRDESFPTVRERSWERIRELIYEGRGG
jgi:hypothetical protein